MLQRSRTRVSAERTSRKVASISAAPLQRSRTRVSAERDAAASDALAQVLASTEPHSCECGEVVLLRSSSWYGCRFNGAALV